jgi:hypothetical protein
MKSFADLEKKPIVIAIFNTFPVLSDDIISKLFFSIFEN